MIKDARKSRGVEVSKLYSMSGSFLSGIQHICTHGLYFQPGIYFRPKFS